MIYIHDCYKLYFTIDYKHPRINSEICVVYINLVVSPVRIAECRLCIELNIEQSFKIQSVVVNGGVGFSVSVTRRFSPAGAERDSSWETEQE